MAVVSRDQWGAAPARGGTHWRPNQPTGHTLHWEGAGGHSDHSQCAAEVRAIQHYHFSTGYSDIAYNWIVCNHGVIYEGRPVAYFESAAQRDGNHYRVAICYMAGPRFPFTQAAKDGFGYLISARDPAATRNRAMGHQDEPTCSTGCPGPEIETYARAGHYGSSPVVAPHPSPPPLPLPQGGVHHPTLRIGAVGPAVMELQRKLNGVAGAHLVTDANFGAHTRQAVINFQAFFKLGTDGIAGPKTWGMLDYCAALKGIH